MLHQSGSNWAIQVSAAIFIGRKSVKNREALRPEFHGVPHRRAGLLLRQRQCTLKKRFKIRLFAGLRFQPNIQPKLNHTYLLIRLGICPGTDRQQR